MLAQLQAGKETGPFLLNMREGKKSNTSNSYQNRYPNGLKRTMLADNDNKKTLTAHVEEKTKQAAL